MSEEKLPSTRNDINQFLQKAKATPPVRSKSRGRLLFAMDATASREPTWDHACQIQAEMFTQTATIGSLDVKLCYYRGFNEFHATAWFNNPTKLLEHMTSVRCLGGHTQMRKVLKQAIKETKNQKINALVFVGDCLEENVDDLCQLAGQLGLLGVPAFVFHEGHDAVAEKAFKQIAHLTSGAYCAFDAGSAQQLKDLLSAVAIYAVGGKQALENFSQKSGDVVKKLGYQLK